MDGVAQALDASLAMSGAAGSPPAPAARPVTAFTPAQLSAVYRVGMQRGSLRVQDSHSATTMNMRAMMSSELGLFLAHIPAGFGINEHTMQPTDVVVFLSMAWIPRHGRTQLSNGEVGPSVSGLRLAIPALDHVFSSRGRGGEWTVHTPYNNPVRSQLVHDYVRGAVRHVRQLGPLPVAAHPLTRPKLALLVAELDTACAQMDATLSAQPLPYQALRRLLKERDALLFVYLYESLQRAGEGASISLRNLSFPDDPLPLRHGDPRLLSAGAIRIHPPTLKTCGGAPSPSTYMDVARVGDPSLCFLRRLHAFMSTCDRLGHPLEVPFGHLFRPADSTRVALRETSMTTAACRSRLKSALVAAGADEGETTHSFRRGATQDARLAGEDPAVTMGRMHIVTPGVYRRYTDQGCPTRHHAPAPPALALGGKGPPPVALDAGRGGA